MTRRPFYECAVGLLDPADQSPAGPVCIYLGVPAEPGKPLSGPQLRLWVYRGDTQLVVDRTTVGFAGLGNYLPVPEMKRALDGILQGAIRRAVRWVVGELADANGMDERECLQFISACATDPALKSLASEEAELR